MKELDKTIVIATISDLVYIYDECIETAKRYEDLKLTSEKYYMQAKVYEYLIECLKNKL